jgi:disulfide oxidoreductase YuzD
LSINKYDLQYIDISTPEVLSYINEITTVVENRLPLPFVTLNEKLLCWGEDDAKNILYKILKKLEEVS